MYTEPDLTGLGFEKQKAGHYSLWHDKGNLELYETVLFIGGYEQVSSAHVFEVNLNSLDHLKDIISLLIP